MPENCLQILYNLILIHYLLFCYIIWRLKKKNVLPDYENGNLTPYKGLKRVGSFSCFCNAFPSWLVCLSQTCKSFYGSKILKSGHINFMVVSKFGDKTICQGTLHNTHCCIYAERIFNILVQNIFDLRNYRIY